MRGVFRETQAAVGQREAASRVHVDRAVDGVEDAAAHLRVRDRPVAGDHPAHLVASPGARCGGQREERREESAEGDRPNDEEGKGPRIPFGGVRHPKPPAH